MRSLVFLLAAGLIGTVTFALDRSARSSTWREHSVALAGGAQVGASSFESLHTSLRIEATQMATSLALQRAIVQHDDIALRRIAAARHARIDSRRSVDRQPSRRTADRLDGEHHRRRPSPRHRFTRDPARRQGRDAAASRDAAPPSCRVPAHAQRRGARRRAGGCAGRHQPGQSCHCAATAFAAQSASLKGTRLALVAVEPVSSIDALSAQYRRLLLLAAAVTLLLVAFVARRIARPLAAIVGDVARLSRQAHTDAIDGPRQPARADGAAARRARARRAQRDEPVLSLVVDVDDFKAINDGHGHQAGDEAIKAVASLLAGSVRETDLAVRLGGEEFVVLLPGARLKNAKATAEKLRLAIEELGDPRRRRRDDSPDREPRHRRVPDVRHGRRPVLGRGLGALPGEALGEEPGCDRHGAARLVDHPSAGIRSCAIRFVRRRRIQRDPADTTRAGRDNAAVRLTRAQLLKGAAAAAGGTLLARPEHADARSSQRVWQFVSRPDLRPPRLHVLHAGPTADGHLFMAPSSGAGQRGVMIVDDGGEIVWFHPTTPQTAMNFRAARYKGEPVLTWWEGKATKGLGTGTHVILDSSYRVVARVPAGHGRQSDLHEFLITPHDTALVTSYEIRTVDLSAVGEPRQGQAIGGLVQELALPSGRVLFEWRSLDHVPIAETHAAYTGHPLDYFHVNSIDLSSDGDFLVSARNTWAVYKVSRTTGKVLWRLGGKRSDFEMGPGTVFAWQHDARHLGHGRISIFDDGAEPQVAPQSRALVLHLDGAHRRARLVRKYTHRPGRIVSRFMGNAQVFDNGNVLVGWGSEPYVTEFGRNGDIRFDARLPRGGQNYRALRFPWAAMPAIPPAIAYRAAGGKRRVHVSWNGATNVAAWELHAGPAAGALAVVGNVRRTGFETAIAVPPGARRARVIALDAAGKRLRASETIRV